MTETPVVFGPGHGLVGVVTVPDGPAAPRLACLLGNTGVLHRVGPHRMNVKLARALARQGVASIRFDHAGLGDSPSGGARGGSREQAVSDLRAAMDHVQASTGIDRFVSVGICSGAANGYALALADERIVGLLMFDGFIYATLRATWNAMRQAPVMALVRRIPSAFRRIFLPWLRRPATLFYAADNPPRDEFRRAMDSLAARGTALCLVYSGSFLYRHNYERQLHEAFRGAAFLGSVQSHLMRDVDHTLTPIAAQRKLAAFVCAWTARLAV